MAEYVINFGIWILFALGTIFGAITTHIGSIAAKEKQNILQAFTVSLIVNILNSVGLISMISAFMPLPYMYFIISLLLWTGLVHLFYSPRSIKNTIIISLVGFGLLYLMNMLGILNMIRSFIPL